LKQQGINEGIEKGIEQGIEKGIEQGIKLGIEKMLKSDYPVEEISRIFEVPEQKVLDIQKEMNC
jgi:flagellar biosynthesis/type III secretory pathway protein FliH